MSSSPVTGGHCQPGWRRSAVPILVAAGVLALGAGPACGQDELQAVWQPFGFFAGAWHGKETGVAGVGTGERVYAFIMDDAYLMSINTSRFDPQERNPEGEVHEDYSIFSYDKLREKIVLREFHSEGFVNQYVLASLEDDGRRFVFESESIENLPAGWKARLTLTIVDGERFMEVFELAAPGEEHEELLRNDWARR